MQSACFAKGYAGHREFVIWQHGKDSRVFRYARRAYRFVVK
jgi:hypothetical protein